MNDVQILDTSTLNYTIIKLLSTRYTFQTQIVMAAQGGPLTPQVGMENDKLPDNPTSASGRGGGTCLREQLERLQEEQREIRRAQAEQLRLLERLAVALRVTAEGDCNEDGARREKCMSE